MLVLSSKIICSSVMNNRGWYRLQASVPVLVKPSPQAAFSTHIRINTNTRCRALAACQAVPKLRPQGCASSAAMSVLVQSRCPSSLCQVGSAADSSSLQSSQAAKVTVTEGQPMFTQSPSSAHVGGPVPALSRTGRHKQRYAPTGERLVAGCIPVRMTQGAGPDSVEILLISSRAGKGFCFPKGGWEDDETVEMAAQRETVEEAGVRGLLEEPMIGIFPFQSGKPGSIETSVHHGRCIAHMYVLHVAEMLDVWPECERQRVWLPLVEALHKCRHDWMRLALLTWVRRKGWPVPPMPTDSAAWAPVAAVQELVPPSGNQQQEQLLIDQPGRSLLNAVCIQGEVHVQNSQVPSPQEPEPLLPTQQQGEQCQQEFAGVNQPQGSCQSGPVDVVVSTDGSANCSNHTYVNSISTPEVSDVSGCCNAAHHKL